MLTQRHASISKLRNVPIQTAVEFFCLVLGFLHPGTGTQALTFNHSTSPTSAKPTTTTSAMICRTCLRWVPTPGLRPIVPRAAFATTARVQNAMSAALAHSDTAKSPSAPKVDPLIDPAHPPEVKTPLSSCPTGTVLQGLNYIKGKTDPVALPDEAYPEWLWKCLEVKKTADAAVDANAGDEFCMYFLPSFSAFRSDGALIVT